MAVARIAYPSLTSAKAGRLADFYSHALGFERVRIESHNDQNFSNLMGLKRTAAQALALRLGNQTLELLEFADPGSRYPSERCSNDTFFQHLAIVVADMQSAYSQLAAAGDWSPITQPGPQELPQSSGGVRAFKFRDPEGHPLELLQFQSGAEPGAWRRPPQHNTFLGIDHSAIVVVDTQTSLDFYIGLLGFRVSYRSLNRGPEQQRLDAVSDAVVEVTGLSPASDQPPHLELLCYRSPPARAAQPTPPASNDVASARLVLELDNFATTVDSLVMSGARLISRIGSPRDGGESALVSDPDGHALVLRPSNKEERHGPGGTSTQH